MIKIGEQFKKIRQYRSKTQKQIQQQANIEQKTLSEFENDKHAPTLKTIVRAGEVLGYSVALIPKEFGAVISRVHGFLEKKRSSNDLVNVDKVVDAFAQSLMDKEIRELAEVRWHEELLGVICEVGDLRVFHSAGRKPFDASGVLLLNNPLWLSRICEDEQIDLDGALLNGLSIVLKPYEIEVVPRNAFKNKVLHVIVVEYVNKYILCEAKCSANIDSKVVPLGMYFPSDYVAKPSLKTGLLFCVKWSVAHLNEGDAMGLITAFIAALQHGQMIDIYWCPYEMESKRLMLHFSLVKIDSSYELQDIRQIVSTLKFTTLEKSVVNKALQINDEKSDGGVSVMTN